MPQGSLLSCEHELQLNSAIQVLRPGSLELQQQQRVGQARAPRVAPLDHRSNVIKAAEPRCRPQGAVRLPVREFRRPHWVVVDADHVGVAAKPAGVRLRKPLVRRGIRDRHRWTRNDDRRGVARLDGCVARLLNGHPRGRIGTIEERVVVRLVPYRPGVHIGPETRAQLPEERRVVGHPGRVRSALIAGVLVRGRGPRGGTREAHEHPHA